MDWVAFATISGPVLGAVAGAAAMRAVEARPKLVTFLGHVSEFHLPATANSPAIDVFTHSVILRNAGKRTATGVRLGHNVLPHFTMRPLVKHEIVDLGGAAREILIPSLVAGEQVEISYLYYPPTTWSQINTHLKCDQGPARVLNVLPTPQLPRWALRVLWILICLGAATALYAAYEFVARLAAIL